MLINKDVKKSRRSKKYKRLYREGLAKKGKTTKKEQIDNIKDFIINAKNIGKSNKQIYTELKIDKRKFYRYLKQINEQNLL